MTRRPAVIAAPFLASLASACGGGHPPPCSGAACASADASQPAARASFRGDGTSMPSFGGWGSAPLPADAAARAGFDWFETGYPGATSANEVLSSAGVRPFAYVNLAELADDLGRGATGYAGPFLRTSDAGSNLHLVDVTDASWQDWLVRRADEAYVAGSRGIKWDAATPDVPPGRSRADVNDAIAAVMRRIRDAHPDLRFIFNQGFEFALAYPQFVDAMETEGLFSARSYPGAYLAPWNDPFYWGPQYQRMKDLQARGIPVLVAEYADPWSQEAQALHDAITAQGFVPYITSADWNTRGRGLNVSPGW